MKYGIDYIGGVNYIDMIVKHHPNGYAAGFLCRAIGWRNGIKAAAALCASDRRCPAIRIHGVWRDNHIFNEDDITSAVAQATKVAKLAKQYSNIKFYYSPWLEHRAPKWLFDRCKKKCREVLPYNIPIVSSGTKHNGINEVHGSLSSSTKYIFSFDGEDMFENDVSKWKKAHRSALLFFGWIPHCNGKKDVDDHTPRPDREDWLTKSDIAKMVSLLGG